MSDKHVTSACDRCTGLCCTKLFGFTGLVLTDEEAKNPLFADKLKPEYDDVVEASDGTRGRYMDWGGEQCPFLNGTRCGIYNERPHDCRHFICHEQTQHEYVRDAIKSNEQLRENLESLGLI